MPIPEQFIALLPQDTPDGANNSAGSSAAVAQECLHAPACQKALDALAPGTHATVLCVNCPARMRKRLAEMGLLPGVSIQMKRTAPMGDPIAFQLRGYQLSLRRADAAQIIVYENLPAAERPGGNA